MKVKTPLKNKNRSILQKLKNLSDP